MLQILLVANSLNVADTVDIAGTVDIANVANIVDVANIVNVANIVDIIVIQINASTGKVSVMLINIQASIDADSSSG